MAEETCVQVALRVRPLVTTEISRGCQQCIQKVLGEPQVIVRGDRYFTFDHVFDEVQNQADIYESAVKGLVTRLFKGYNVTILAYGQTGSGKTYSMGTCCTEESDDVGIIPRAIADIFDTVAKLKDDWVFKISVSFMELYQEQLFDLLAEQRCSVELREENKEIRIPNLTDIPVTNPQDTIKCLTQGSVGRATGATAMNSQSSRSHAIFTINIHQQNKLDENEAMTAKFHLVDLAGSERSKKTLATGERFKEGVNINKGLLALGNVISALGEEGQKSYISYRDSKLTRLLQDSLGGNSLTLMIACVSPADYNLEETVSTLRYADRAKRIKNKPRVNQDQRIAELLRYKQQGRDLQLQLLGGTGLGGGCPVEHQRLGEENMLLVTKNRRLNEILTRTHDDVASLSELALTAERSRDVMKAKLSVLSTEFSVTVDVLNLATDTETFSPEVRAALDDLNKLRDMVHDLEADQKRSCEEILKKALSHTSFDMKMANNNENDSMSSTADIDLRHEEHGTQQQELNKELQDLNRALALKEELASEMAKTSNHLRHIQPASELTMKEFQEQIETLTKEKEKLMAENKNVHQHNNAKVSEQRRKHLQELEHKIADLKKKVAEQAKIIKMNEQNDKKIVKLNEDIQSMKQAKVRLVRQMRLENERFRAWQAEQKREICKLTTQNRQRQIQIVNMERQHDKQQRVLKRKWEEAASANKRLTDALAVQKSAQERRRLNQTHGSALSRLQTFVNQEIEVVLSRFECTRTLDSLLEDRAIIHDQRSTLQNNVKETDLSESEREDLTKEIAQLTEQLAYRNIQIEDLQQKLIETDQDNKKVKWDNLQSMAEAKMTVKYLFDLAIEAKREVAIKDYQLKDFEDCKQQAKSRVEEQDQKLREISLKHQQELILVEKEHQDKVLVLLRQLRGIKVEEGGSHFNDSLHILIQGLEKIDSLKEELEARDAAIVALKQQLQTALTNKQTGRSSLFPVAVPLLSVKPKKAASKPPTTSVVLDISDYEVDENDDTDKDPDWQKTPIFKRIQKMKSRSDDKDVTQRAVKRSSDGQAKCTCKGMCINKLCGCRKLNTECGPECKCDPSTCKNQQRVDKKLDLDDDTDSSKEARSDEESFKKPRFHPFQESNRLTAT